ncbi:hypothetical protein ACLE20_08040 [Rhizobium sp. YIM 134829]|uniref:hypothetical protein n=1 Tax=Rhizobium sp. YIM 134829 TaxID=3390453 RepID=UPI00397BB9EB
MSEDEEGALRRALMAVVAGRPISLVGNARSLLDQTHGVEIDRGCVVRLNSGVPIHAAAQGRRTDIHCFSTRSSLEENLRRATWRVRWKRRSLDRAFSVWMSKMERETATDPGQAFYPLDMVAALDARLGAPSSVGAKALDMLVELTDSEIRLFGFDFKASTTFYRKRENRGPHDWEAERDFALSLAKTGRVIIRG